MLILIIFMFILIFFLLHVMIGEAQENFHLKMIYKICMVIYLLQCPAFKTLCVELVIYFKKKIVILLLFFIIKMLFLFHLHCRSNFIVISAFDNSNIYVHVFCLNCFQFKVCRNSQWHLMMFHIICIIQV